MTCTLGGENQEKLPELRRIAADTPSFSSFTEVNSYHSGKRENAGLFYFYSSPANYDEVKRFYTETLTAKGWSYPEERPVPKWLIDDGSKVLVFRKGEYRISVEYDAATGTRWRYSVSFVWEMK